MNTKLLTELADFLDALPKEKFDLSIFRSECGTTACALGWAATMPSFRKSGMLMTDRDGDVLPHDTKTGGRGFASPLRILDITLEDSCHLFGGLGSPLKSSDSASTVATHIRKFIKTKGEAK